MKQIPFNALACPLDTLQLTCDGKTATCANGHSFDFDRKGTLNLLPVQFKKSLHPGDSKAMVAARRQFLNAGFYKPVADRLNTLVARYAMAAQKDIAFLDAGCGEGYYTAALADYLALLDYEAAFSGMGLDISKEAITAAAARGKDVQWAVGTNAKLPVADAAIDCVISLFGFPVWSEFSRVLKRSGLVIVGESGPDHLIELRRALYPEIREKAKPRLIPDGFVSAGCDTLRTQFSLADADAVAALIAMTPHGHRATADKIHDAMNTRFDRMTLHVEFSLYCHSQEAAQL